MGICDMCGRDSELYKVIVEGSVIEVCESCSKYGTVIEAPKKKEVIRKIDSLYIDEEDNKGETLAEDFSFRIKKAREKKGLTQERLALALAEKEGTIHRLESGQLKPSDVLLRKLEQFLQINLKEENKDKKKINKTKEDINFRDKGLTIGDILDAKNKKQEGP
ncbi:MAG: multiprotein bridging factor aMBF1 [Candidatus Nanoarchaeia archaeon]|nr:multiprotein bridging factor aMBF1 [Candidatus Nanoarchaeia archaeon]